MVAFGVIMYFLYSCVLGIVLASVLGGVLALIGRMVVPSTAPGRRKFLWSCFRRPFLLIPWTLLVFIAYSYANGIIFHRDNGLGVDIHVPLSDGYLLGCVNYNSGYTLTPETTVGTFPSRISGTVYGVNGLQMAGPFILGSSLTSYPTRFDLWRWSSGTYFLLDTRTRSVATFSTLDELLGAASSKGIEISLESPFDLYSRYRRTWFDWSFPVISALGLACLIASLWRRAVQIRHRSNESQELSSVI